MGWKERGSYRELHGGCCSGPGERVRLFELGVDDDGDGRFEDCEGGNGQAGHGKGYR